MTKKLVACGILSSVAIAISSLERFLPIQAFIPLPGLKVGIANCVILFLLIKLNFKSAFAVMLCKCLVTSLLFSNPVSFFYSLLGGIMSVIGMHFLLKFKKTFSVIGVSIFGAALFNVGQITAAALVLKSIHIYKYLSLLLFSSIATGFITGIIVIILLKNLRIRW